MSIKINDVWSIQRHTHGGFNLIKTEDKGINPKTGKPTISKRSYYYPSLRLCAEKMVECSFDNDAKTISEAVESMRAFTIAITSKLEQVEQ